MGICSHIVVGQDGGGARGYRVAEGSAQEVALDQVRDPLHLQYEDGGRAWTWRLRDGTVRPVPPYDESASAFSHAPRIEGADLRWVWTPTGCPFGPVSVVYEAVDGIPVEVVHTSSPMDIPCDFWVEFPYVRGLQLRAGMASVLDVVAPPASLGGDIDSAMFLAGAISADLISAVAIDPRDAERLTHLALALHGGSLSDAGVDLP